MVEYKTNNKKVKIICKDHGIFEQTPTLHYSGFGCSICNSSSKGELKIFKYLKNYKINFENQYSFKNCRNILPLPFDFYLPDHNLCIEYDGIQHFKPIIQFGGDIEFKKVQLRDKIKTKYCNDNNIKLLRIKYNENIIEKLDDFVLPNS